jgi:hypothetical protein
MTQLEFWPDYGGALLWDEHGSPVSLDTLPIPEQLRNTADQWVQDYDDQKLPWEATGDEAWLARGRQVLSELRSALAAHGIEIQPNEAYWESG